MSQPALRGLLLPGDACRRPLPSAHAQVDVADAAAVVGTGCNLRERPFRCHLDPFWLKDESLEANDNLPEPGVIAAEIVEDLRSALEQFAQIENDLSGR